MEKKLKIGLIHSPDKEIGGNQNFGLDFPPVWAYLLSSYIDKCGAVPELFDVNVNSMDKITECDLFFFSGINQDINAIKTAFIYCKKWFPDSIYFIGGPIAWSYDQSGDLHEFKEFDHICIGDGELLVPKIIECYLTNSKLDHVVRAEIRYELDKSIAMSESLIRKTFSNYYGAVIEVSRGCPFLCEFCDIRVLPDNNRNHSKQIDLIIHEINIYRELGVKNFQLACDNFIGDLNFAKLLVDAILENNIKHDFHPSFYTWLTINISNHSELMSKMRNAGFDVIFIGVESFNRNTLLETAKLQNTKSTLPVILKEIQSYGFIVAAGLIFGFDGDDSDVADIALAGIKDSALLSGEPSLLSAIPGTPLYTRMLLSGRLRTEDIYVRHKFRTNIKYLLPAQILASNFIIFYKNALSGSYNYGRLKAFYQNINSSNSYIKSTSGGVMSPTSLLILAIKRPSKLLFYLDAVTFVLRGNNFYYVFIALLLTLKYVLAKKIGFNYFIFWMYIWVSLSGKYKNISTNDIDIESVEKDFDFKKLIPEKYYEIELTSIPRSKQIAQKKATASALQKIIDEDLRTR